MARDRGIADYGHLEVGEDQRLDDLLAGHYSIDELLLGLDSSIGMTVADVGGCRLLQLGFVSLEQCPAQGLDALGDRCFVAGVGARGASEQKAGGTNRNCACNYLTTRYVHGFPPLGHRRSLDSPFRASAK